MEARMKDHLRSNWSGAVLVCAKCTKKVGGGFGPKGKTPLGKALRRHLSLKKGRKSRAGVVDVRCLGVCPKDAVTVVDTANPRDWLLVRPGTDLDLLAVELGLRDAGAVAAVSVERADEPARMTF